VDDEIIDRLVADPVFAELPAPSMERLGRTVERHHAPAETAVVVQGDVGDHYYVIVEGEFAVTKDGATVNRLGPDGVPPNVNCATCHQGASKPLLGANLVKTFPELQGGGTSMPAAAPESAPQPQ